MEPIELLLELSCCLLETVDIGTIIISVMSWFKSAPNRVARKEAKTVGAEPPPKDFWFQMLVFSAPIGLTLTGIVVYKYVRWLTR